MPVVKISILPRRQVSPKDIVETCRTIIIEVEVFLSHLVEGDVGLAHCDEGAMR